MIEVKVFYFRPVSPNDLERFLQMRYKEGYRLIAMNDDYYVFERIS